jgi:hypothetical protein
MKRLFAIAIVLAPAACFNASAYTPIIGFVGDANAPTSSVGRVLTGTTSLIVGGGYFAPGMVVYWNGRPQATSFRTDQEVIVSLDAGLTGAVGTAQLSASNDGGFQSKAFAVQILQATPTLASVSPPQLSVSTTPMTLTITGTGFLPETKATWNGISLAVTVVSVGKLTAVVPAALLTTGGDGVVQVDNPACDAAFTCLGPSNPIVCSVGTSTRITAAANATADAFDLAWDATRSSLYAVLGSTPSPDFIVPIDPATGDLGTPVTLQGPIQISISSQDQFLYAATTSTPTVPNSSTPGTRYSLPGLTGATPVPASVSILGIAAAPGAPETAAFITTSGQPGVLDGVVARPNLGQSGAQQIAWGADATTLYAVSSGVLQALHIDQTGVASASRFNNAQLRANSQLHYDPTARLIYGDQGESFDEQGIAQPGFIFVNPDSRCKAVMDGAGGRIFFACTDDKLGLFIRSFDLTTHQPLASIFLAAADPFVFGGNISVPSKIIRFGADGLAVATSKAVYLYSGQFVH